MTKLISKIILNLALAVIAFPIFAGETATTVPLYVNQGGTYYVQVDFAGIDSGEMMLDTGSEFLVINESTLNHLQARSQVKYLKDVIGVMANGSEISVPVYHLSSFSVGCCCVIEDVEVAVFPRNTRQILGLTALRKVAPFSVSLEPASLTLSHCKGTDSLESITPVTDASHPKKAPYSYHDIAGLIRHNNSSTERASE